MVKMSSGGAFQGSSFQNETKRPHYKKSITLKLSSHQDSRLVRNVKHVFVRGIRLSLCRADRNALLLGKVNHVVAALIIIQLRANFHSKLLPETC
jgi:hypothetical protein